MKISRQELAKCAFLDAANASMRKRKAKHWNAEDYNAGVAAQDKVYPLEDHFAVLRGELDPFLYLGKNHA